MLPEIAWSLKLGELVVATTLDGRKIEGAVSELLRTGLSVMDYLDSGHTVMDAFRLQNDGPIIVIDTMRARGTLWRPDAVERVTQNFVIKCHVCNQYVTLKLAIRTIQKMANGEPLPYSLELEKPSVAEQISKSLCEQHVSINSIKN